MTAKQRGPDDGVRNEHTSSQREQREPYHAKGKRTATIARVSGDLNLHLVCRRAAHIKGSIAWRALSRMTEIFIRRSSILFSNFPLPSCLSQHRPPQCTLVQLTPTVNVLLFARSAAPAVFFFTMAQHRFDILRDGIILQLSRKERCYTTVNLYAQSTVGPRSNPRDLMPPSPLCYAVSSALSNLRLRRQHKLAKALKNNNR